MKKYFMKNSPCEGGSKLLSILLMISFCSPFTLIAQSKHRVYFQLDSVFINQVDKARAFRDVPYIFYHFSIHNNSDEQLEASIRSYDFESRTTDDWYGLFKRDKFELYSSGMKARKIVIPPRSTTKISLNVDALFILNHFDSVTIAKKTIDILKPLATTNRFHFELNGTKIPTVVRNNLKLVFRDPKDTSIVEWK